MWRHARRSATLGEIEAVYRARAAAFERVATAITGDDQLGADAVHDGFVLAVRHRRRFRRESSLEAWLWRIVLNEARKRRAEAARLVATDPEVFVEAPSENGHAGDERTRALLAALPERQRHALFLRYYADLDYAAIGAALGVAPGTVAATLSAAHATLRTQLQEVGQ